MRLGDWIRVLTVTAVTAGVLAGSAGSASAQRPLEAGEGFERMPRAGIGYVVNAPNIFVGGMGYALFDVFGGLGLYVDVKWNPETPADRADYIDTLTVEVIELFPGQLELQDEFGWWSVNAALVRPISPELMLYAGAGYTEEDRYVRYNDRINLFDFGIQGRYWVRDEQESGGRINLLAGLFFRMSDHVALQFGVETAPEGVTVGGSYSIPF